MWKTALKPQWIAGFVFAIVVSGVFVLLSQWQFGRSTTPEIPVNPATEDVRPLTGTLEPGSFFPSSVADQMVSATGSYDPGHQVLVADRFKDGAKGYWVIDAFKVDGAPVLQGVAASPETWIPVARGWVADPESAPGPPSGSITLTGRLLPSEAPLADTAAGPGRATAVSTAELINQWEVSSYPAFIAAASELAGGADVSASAVESPLKPLEIGPQPPAQTVNWLNLFYSIEWVVFAGFALFIWWRLVKDDYNRDREEELDDDELHEDHAGHHSNSDDSNQPRTASPTHNSEVTQ